MWNTKFEPRQGIRTKIIPVHQPLQCAWLHNANLGISLWLHTHLLSVSYMLHRRNGEEHDVLPGVQWDAFDDRANAKTGRGEPGMNMKGPDTPDTSGGHYSTKTIPVLVILQHWSTRSTTGFTYKSRTFVSVSSTARAIILRNTEWEWTNVCRT